jgi:5'-3' exonuclease
VALLLVDSASLYFRAFHGVPESVTAPDGRPVNAVRGFLDMIATVATRRHPDRFVACLDADWRPAFRVALLPSYKAHRAAAGGTEIVPTGLVPQVPVLLDVMAGIGLAVAGCPGFEADDVIATLAERDTDAVEVVSGDRDLFGMVSDRVHLLYVGRGVSKMAVCGPAEVTERYGVPAAHYADFAALRGDPSDGLPGVPGVGERTAAALVSRFGSVEAIVSAAEAGPDGFPAGVRSKILAGMDYLRVAPGVVRMRTDAPVEPVDATIPAEVANAEWLSELADTHGVRSSITRVCTAFGIGWSTAA